jgi:hypothetical protein
VDGAALTATGAALGLEHRQAADGCFTGVALTIALGGSCRLDLRAGGRGDGDGALLLSAVTLRTSEDCGRPPGVWQALEPAAAGRVELLPARPPEFGSAGACVVLTLRVALDGVLLRSTDGQALAVAAHDLLVDGTVSSAGDPAAACPCVPACAAPDGRPDGCGGCCGGCRSRVLAASPAELRFQARHVGGTSTLDLRLTSVGRDPVTVAAADLLVGASPAFTRAPEGERASGAAVPLDRPFELAPAESLTVRVSYAPATASPVNEATGVPIPDTATLRVHHDGDDAPLDVPVSGWGVTTDSPVAVVVTREGEEVIPQTMIHLQGDQSYAAEGEITRWAWRVDQPTGSQSVFVPSATVPNPTFEANVAGRYMFYLDVWDARGRKSESPAVFELVVVPDGALHIELLWTTPGDPDETDSGPFAGADVDLHFLHPSAPSIPTAPDLDGDGRPDPYFDQPFDCYWFNPRPDWGAVGSALDDDPSLDRDDTDGAGPENINLSAPENGRRYGVAVHYWNDHAYGPSLVTLRIYVHQQLVAEKTSVRLINYDLWHAAWIDWPSGEVTWQQNANGSEYVTPNYRHPLFFNK